MSKVRLEIRIEKEKKEALKTIAKGLGLDISKVLDLLIDELINNKQCININKKSEIVRHMMYLNNIACEIDKELKNELSKVLLKELGELECLL